MPGVNVKQITRDNVMRDDERYPSSGEGFADLTN